MTVAETDFPALDPPIGLAYIAAVLLENGYEVRIIDAVAEGMDNQKMTESGLTRVGLSEDDIKSKIEACHPDIVGITCMFTSLAQDAHNVARIVKQLYPKCLVVFGGVHPTAVPEIVLADENVDIVVRGEGELTFLELIRRLETGGDIFSVAGTITRKNGQIVENPPREYISDLDSLPFPARHLLPMDKYLYKPSYILSYSMREPRANMITSRGCPGNCVFCAVHTVWGRRWRARSAKNVVDEIQHLVETYKVREVYFLDDNVSVKKDRLLQICDEIIRRKLNIKWATPNGIAIWTLDSELMEKMKQSGYYRATFGIESGDAETSKFIGKPINFNKSREIIKICHRLGLWIHSTFVIGFPYEKKESIRATIEFAKNSGIDFASFYNATPFPGTRLYQIFTDEGLLPKDLVYRSTTVPTTNTKFFTKTELEQLQKDAYAEFLRHRILSYLNPIVMWTQLFPKLKSLDGLQYLFKVGTNVIRMKWNSIRYGQFRTHLGKT
jgi:anaerobic magnesium-protoporphyrin IX monomethyl ester cyclase